MSFLILTLSSCLVRKEYTRDEKVTEDLTVFRIDDYVARDSFNIGQIQWQEYFSDAQLKSYITSVLENNIDHLIALENLQSSQSMYMQSKSAYYPNLSIAPGASYVTQSLNTQFGQIIGERRHIVQYDVTGTLSWEADIWGKITSQSRSRQAQFLSTLAGRQALQSRLVSQTASLYYELLASDAQKDILERTIATRKASLETTRALKEAGTLTEVAVQQSEALLYNAEALLLQLNHQINVLENSFNILMNRPMQKVERHLFAQVSMNTDWSYGVPYQLLSQRPDIIAAEYNLISNFEMVNVARASFYPSLRISGSAGLQSIDIDKIFNPISLFANIVGNLTQPIFNQRNIRTNHEVSLNNREIAYLQYRQTVLMATKEVSDALSAIEHFDAIEALKNKELKAYASANEYSEELVEYGMANYLEVLRAQENLLNAELAELNAQLNKYNAYIQLYRALGGG